MIREAGFEVMRPQAKLAALEPTGDFSPGIVILSICPRALQENKIVLLYVTNLQSFAIMLRGH